MQLDRYMPCKQPMIPRRRSRRGVDEVDVAEYSLFHRLKCSNFWGLLPRLSDLAGYQGHKGWASRRRPGCRERSREAFRQTRRFRLAPPLRRAHREFRLSIIFAGVDVLSFLRSRSAIG